MAMEQLTLVPATARTDGVDGVESRAVASGDGADDGGKTPRLPRWTRQEILVLIQGKRVAENRVRRGRASVMATGGQVESKWSSVSNYCKRHGVNRGPVQCRKRWSNLAGDYKKIKDWEARVRDEKDSFWVMRNDLRKERRLPGFFDREVYDILERGPTAPAIAPDLDLALGPAAMDVDEEKSTAAEETDAGRIPDSSRDSAVAVAAAATEDGLFSDFEPEEGVSPKRVAVARAAPETIPERQDEPVFQGIQPEGTSTKEQQPPANPELGSVSEDARKRKRVVDASPEDDHEEVTITSLQYRLVDALERNGDLLVAQLEAQNKNSQLDRELRKDQANGLLTILNKLADALVRIADKL